MHPTPMFLAYFSPETMLPLSSLIATVIGFGLLIKRSSIRFLVQFFRTAIRTARVRTGISKPHLAPRSRRPTPKTRS